MAAVTTAPPRNAPLLHLPDYDTDTPRSSNISTSNEKVDLSVASASVPRKSSPKHQNKENSVDRTASPKRWKTFMTSFKYLKNLTPKQVDDYMSSYVIYNLDWENEDEMISALGPNYQERVGDCLRAYYGVINHLCALGDVEKMYIPPQINRQASVLDNQLLNEEAIAREVGLKPGYRVLDLGCGRGRVAAHMSNFSGAKVTGLNIDPNQIAQAREFNAELGLQNEFVEHDQNNLPLPFADASFDAFYEIQALSLCKDPRALFKEIFRVLKPGSKFLLMDWVSLPAYNPENPEHVKLMQRVKPLIGAVGTPTPASFETALTEAGFSITRSDIPGVDSLQSPLIDKVDIYFRTVRQAILALVKLKMLPNHFKQLINRLCLDGQAFVEMDNMRLITTVYQIVAQKPPA